MTLLKNMAVLLGFALIVLSIDTAWACSGEGTACTSNVGLPGTCVSGSCVEKDDPDGTCTFDPIYNINYPAPGTGIVATIVKTFKQELQPLAYTMFQSMINDTGVSKAAIAAMTLYIIVYAVTFMFGMVQLTVFDFFLRVVKIGVVATLLSGSAWTLFSSTFVHFFNDGTDSLIAQVSTTILLGGNTLGGQPFDWIDRSIVELTSVKMMVTLMAAFATGPYGWAIIILLGIGLVTFVKAMLGAIWIYLMALVMRTLLFGLAPLFLACVMFSRTRQLFDGWLNQVLNTCLQPIFLFAFFSFFIQLIKTVLDQVISQDVCWTEVALYQGSVDDGHYWRFAIFNGSIWVPFDKIWDYNGPGGAPGPGGMVAPLGIMTPLLIWLLSDLARKFNDTVVQVAKDIASASTSLSFEGGTFGGREGNSGRGRTNQSPTTRSPTRPTRANQNRSPAQMIERMRQLANVGRRAFNANPVNPE